MLNFIKKPIGYVVLLVSIAPMQGCFADACSRLEQEDVSYARLKKMNERSAQVIVEIGKPFQVSKFCFPHQSWRLIEPLPEHVVCCGLEIKDDILYENDWVLGGPPIHEYRYTFEVTRCWPAHIYFESSDPDLKSYEIILCVPLEDITHE